MLPKSVGGWIVLIIVILILMYGVSGGFHQAGVLIHEAINGLKSFGQGVRNG
jgi:hypothetical protein